MRQSRDLLPSQHPVRMHRNFNYAIMIIPFFLCFTIVHSNWGKNYEKLTTGTEFITSPDTLGISGSLHCVLCRKLGRRHRDECVLHPLPFIEQRHQRRSDHGLFATGLPVGTGIFILNIPIMIACYKFMGRRYTLLSIVGTIMLSILADATAFLSTWKIMDDPMLSSITGGILSGIGFGIIYKYNGNSGGLDVIGAIVKKYYSLEMGTVTMILNLVILSAAAYMFSLERAVLTFVAIYIAAFITNKVVLGLKQRKSVLIISNRSTPIAQVLMRYIGHGATYIHGQGAYTMQDKRVIYAVIKLTEVAKVKEIVNKLDPQAFMIISDASEVVGRGFTSSPVKYHQYPGDALSMPHTQKNMPPEY